MKLLLPFGILLLCIALLQYHSIAFWTWAISGREIVWGWGLLAAPWGGWGWSVMLELVNLWAWPQVFRKFSPPRLAGRGWGWGALAALTTLLLVAGPLYRVSDGLLRELAAPPVLSPPNGAIAQETPEIATARAEISTLESSLAVYRDDWRLRPQIPAQEVHLRVLYTGLKTLLAERTEAAAAARLDWRRWLVVAGQLAVIVVAQTGAVLAILVLSGAEGVTLFGSSTRNPEPGTPNPERGSAPAEPAPKALIVAYGKRHGLAYQSQVAERIGEPKSTLSEFANGKTPPDVTARIRGKLNG